MHDINDIYNQLNDLIFIIKFIRDCVFVFMVYVAVRKLFRWRL